MRMHVLACSGRKLAAVDCSPSWQLPDVLAAVQQQAGPFPGCKVHIFYKDERLIGHLTLAGIGAAAGGALTLVLTATPRIACSHGSAVRVVCAASGEVLHTLRDHVAPVRPAMFSPDNQKMVTLCTGGKVRLRCVSSGECLHTLRGHEGPVESAVFSPDGGSLLTAEADGTSKLWSATSFECIATLRAEGRAAFSFDGQKVFTLGWLNHSLAKIWSAASGECLCTLGFNGGREPNGSFVLSPDGQVVLTLFKVLSHGEDEAKLWSASSGECLRALPALRRSNSGTAAFSPDSRRVLTMPVNPPWAPWRHESAVQLWSTASWERVRTLRGHGGPPTAAMFSPDSRQVLTASIDCTGKVWCADSGECLHTLRGHRGLCGLKAASFSNDSAEVLTVCYDGTALFWSATSGELQRAMKGMHDAVFLPTPS